MYVLKGWSYFEKNIWTFVMCSITCFNCMLGREAKRKIQIRVHWNQQWRWSKYRTSLFTLSKYLNASLKDNDTEMSKKNYVQYVLSDIDKTGEKKILILLL